jgi:hypothetical protein
MMNIGVKKKHIYPLHCCPPTKSEDFVFSKVLPWFTLEFIKLSFTQVDWYLHQVLDSSLFESSVMGLGELPFFQNKNNKVFRQVPYNVFERV